MKWMLFIAVAIGMAACTRRAEEAEIAKELEETKRALEQVREEKKQENEKGGGTGDGEMTEEEKLAKKQAEEEAAKRAAEENAAKERRDAERAQYLALQKAAVGSEFEEIQMRGRTYKTATIKAIDDHGVRVAHSSGAFTVRWKDVPENFRKAWGYDPDREGELAVEQKEREELAAEEAARPPTPEELKAAEEAKKEKIRAAKSADQKKIAELQGKMASADAEISNLKSQLRELNQRYYLEDIGRAKGAKTHSTVRKKNRDQVTARIARLEKAAAEAYAMIRSLKRKNYRDLE